MFLIQAQQYFQPVLELLQRKNFSLLQLKVVLVIINKAIMLIVNVENSQFKQKWAGPKCASESAQYECACHTVNTDMH